jgi:hypothetical protein
MSKYDRLLGPRWGGCAVGPHEQSRVALLLLGGSLFAEVLFRASSGDILGLLSLLG